MSDDNNGWTGVTSGTSPSAAPETYDLAAQIANCVYQSIRQHPVSGSAAGVMLGYALGFLLHHQRSNDGSSSDSRDQDVRSWRDAAADTARSVAGTARSTAPATYDRAAQAKDSFDGSIRQYALSGSVAAALLGFGLGYLSRRGRRDAENE